MGRSLVFVVLEEHSWAAEPVAEAERFLVGKMAAEEHTWRKDQRAASCLFFEAVLAVVEVGIDRSSPFSVLVRDTQQQKHDCCIVGIAAEVVHTNRLTAGVHMVPEEHFQCNNSQLLQQCSAY